MTDASNHVRLDTEFAQIPQALLYDPERSDGAVRVYGVLVRHGQDPSNCYPGYARIAGLVGKSPRSIPAIVRELEDAGWITRVPRWRRGDEVVTTLPDDDGWEPTSNGYVVHARAPERGVRAPERVPPRAELRVPPAHQNAPKESQENESHLEELPLVVADAPTRALTVPDPFDEFWQVYPRKVGKPTAQRAFARALKRADAAAIIAGARAYAAAQAGKDPRYTKHPGPWLNDDRWNDDHSADTGPRLKQSTVAAAGWAARKEGRG